MRIGIDMMGGDFAPLEAVKGIRLYLSGHTVPAQLVLIGDVAAIARATRHRDVDARPVAVTLAAFRNLSTNSKPGPLVQRDRQY